MTQGIVVTSEGPPLLCQRHYQHLYRQAHAPAVCADCGAKPKYGTTFSRHSPNATLITVHLKESTGFEGEIKDDDTICMSCYKCHLSILQETSGSINRAALEYDINTWKHQLPNCEDTLTIALLTSVVHVATELLQDRALLLPQVCDVFLSKYGTVRNSSQLYLEVGDSEVQFSSRWLLHQLIVYLHSYMRYKCIHKKFGIVLYRNGGDLLQSLSWALGSKCQTHSSENSFEPLQTELQTSKLHRGEQKVIKLAATIINNLILEEVRRLAGKDKETDLKCLNIDSLISEINPLLWEFVTSITRPAYQQKSS